MTNKIITPIYYVGGTGGHFLSALLNSAEANHKEPLNFSTYGHAHDTKFGVNQKINEKNIEQFTKFNKDKFSFISTHSPIDFLLNNFDRLIVIKYDILDTLEIASSLVMKVAYTNGKPKEIVLSRRIAAKITLMCSATIFNELDNEKIFYISWNDLYRKDPNELIDILHQYTNIPKENFNINSIHEWRRLTSKSIEQCNEFARNYSFT